MSISNERMERGSIGTAHSLSEEAEHLAEKCLVAQNHTQRAGDEAARGEKLP
jgi:hypothetical protein